MYCPNCATQNSDDTKFCRACGANLSLVPQALTGRLPGTRSKRHGKLKKSGDPPTIANGIRQSFAGAGFILAAFGAMLFAPAGRLWWFWLLIPAFAMIGKGIAEIVAAKYEDNALPESTAGEMPREPRAVEPPRRDTGELMPPPPSVTEHTTRQLDPRGRQSKETG